MMQEAVAVTKIEYLDEEIDVYDLNVDEDHTYVANGFMSHNSATALSIGKYMAEQGARVGYGSFEMNAEMQEKRLLANISQTPLKKIRNPKTLTKSDKTHILKSFDEFTANCERRGGLFTSYAPSDDVTLEEFIFLLEPFGYDVEIVDYLNLLAGMDTDDQWRKLMGGARFCKRYAASRNKVIILLAQLGDDGALRYAKGLKDHVDYWWGWQYNEEARESGIITIKQYKARNDQLFDFPVEAAFDMMTVKDVSSEDLAKTETKRLGSNKKDDNDDDDSYMDV